MEVEKVKTLGLISRRIVVAGVVGWAVLVGSPMVAKAVSVAAATVGATIAAAAAAVSGDSFITLVLPTRVPDAPAPAPVEENVSVSSQPTGSGLSSGVGAGANSLGGSVSVAGAPNQTFSITLPGQTSFSTGVSVVEIAGFSHDAGSTPTVDPTGGGAFNVSAEVASVAPTAADTGLATDTGAAVDSATGAAADGQDGGQTAAVVEAIPIATESPFVDVIISYN